MFEFVTDKIGAQSTICAGGRYDGLIEQLGGPALPGIGFAMGLERILMTMEACGSAFPQQPECAAFIGSMGDKAGAKAAQLATQRGMKDSGLSATPWAGLCQGTDEVLLISWARDFRPLSTASWKLER